MHPVGGKKANTWGLHDMHGNVAEWCADWYDAGYYAKSPTTDPTGSGDGSYRVVRGGSWLNDAWPSACRGRVTPNLRYGSIGFRLVAVPSGQ